MIFSWDDRPSCSSLMKNDEILIDCDQFVDIGWKRGDWRSSIGKISDSDRNSVPDLVQPTVLQVLLLLLLWRFFICKTFFIYKSFLVQHMNGISQVFTSVSVKKIIEKISWFLLTFLTPFFTFFISPQNTRFPPPPFTCKSCSFSRTKSSLYLKTFLCSAHERDMQYDTAPV